jgi:PilZ domain
MEPDPVTDSRAFPRFVVLDPLPGYFAGTDITILYMAEGGMQLQHAEPLKVNARARVGFRLGDQSMSLPAIVVWSRLSKTTHEQGKLLDSSGIRLDDP